jgi:hypothetical protein
MKVGNGVNASFDLSLLVARVGIAYGATLIGELRGNLETGSYLSRVGCGFSRQQPSDTSTT